MSKNKNLINKKLPPINEKMSGLKSAVNPLNFS
jgi:hypothetical protein